MKLKKNGKEKQELKTKKTEYNNQKVEIMKTKRTKITALVLCLFMTLIGYSQTTYLKISKSDKNNDYEMYPPGTKFELKNEHGYIVFKNSDDPGEIDIDGDYTLYVYPSWKKTPDVIKLKEGRLEKVLKKTYTIPIHEYNTIESNGVTANFKVTDSEDFKGKKNLYFELSNGITFRYSDGKYNAYLNDEENYLNIVNKYLVESKMGTLKLSFNPNNGETWWIFEPTKK